VDKNLKDKAINLMFLLPLFIVFALVIFYPFLYVVGLSLYKESLSGALTFIGFDNYQALLNSPDFYLSFKNTVAWTLGGVVLKVGGGLLVALVLFKNFRFKNLVLLCVLIPWAIPFSVSQIAWRWMYNSLYGHLNSLLFSVGLISAPLEWLSNPSFSLWGVLIANSWTGIPFCAFAILSGLYAIPNHLFEAADIDGASAFQTFYYVTRPLITPVLLLMSALTAIWTYTNFGAVWIMTQGGPVNSSTTMIVDIYKYAFEYNRPGQANAMSVLSAIFMVLLTSVYVIFNRKEELI
jgi:ABC-type sugar transport system permease subunit